jgi:hypothetical protein
MRSGLNATSGSLTPICNGYCSAENPRILYRWTAAVNQQLPLDIDRSQDESQFTQEVSHQRRRLYGGFDGRSFSLGRHA